MGLSDVVIGAWVALSLVLSRDGWLERRDAHDALAWLLAQHINGSRRAMARVHVRTTDKLFGQAILFVVIGVVSWLGVHTIYPFPAMGGIIFSAAMFGVLIWSLIVTRIDRRERAALMRTLYEDHE